MSSQDRSLLAAKRLQRGSLSQSSTPRPLGEAVSYAKEDSASQEKSNLREGVTKGSRKVIKMRMRMSREKQRGIQERRLEENMRKKKEAVENK